MLSHLEQNCDQFNLNSIKPKKMAQLIKLIPIVVLLLSCKNEANKTNAEMDYLQQENNRLNEKISKIEEEKKLNEAISSFKQESIDNSKNNEGSVGKMKYVFVLLSGTERVFDSDKWQRDRKTERIAGVNGDPNDGYVTVDCFYASKIVSFSNLTEEAKYKFIDEVQREEDRDNKLSGTYSCNIRKRECLVFDTYKEASLARAKYTTY
jgi:hypothetical protein